MPIKHSFVSSIADGGDATLVRPSNWNADHAIDTFVDLPVIPPSSTPAPSSTVARIAAQNIGGQITPQWRTIDDAYLIQQAIYDKNVIWVTPNTGTTAPSALGMSWTVAATQSHPTIVSSTYLSQMARIQYSTSATSGNAAGIRATRVHAWRSNQAGQGGFFFAARIGMVTVQSAMQFWCGLSEVAGLLAGQPSAQNNTVAIAKDSTDTNYQLLFRNASSFTKTDLGFAPAVNDVLDVYFYTPPNANTITARVVNVVANSVVLDNVSYGTAATPLPVNTAFLLAHAEIRNTSASSVACVLSRMYIESDS